MTNLESLNLSENNAAREGFYGQYLAMGLLASYWLSFLFATASFTWINLGKWGFKLKVIRYFNFDQKRFPFFIFQFCCPIFSIPLGLPRVVLSRAHLKTQKTEIIVVGLGFLAFNPLAWLHGGGGVPIPQMIQLQPALKQNGASAKHQKGQGSMMRGQVISPFSVTKGTCQGHGHYSNY